MGQPEIERDPSPGEITAPQSGTELSTDGVLLVLKFVEQFLTVDELRFYRSLKPGEYVLLAEIHPIWESLTKRIPVQMKAAVKGMIYRNKRILDAAGAKTPADALRVANLLYQSFNRGPRIGGWIVVAEKEMEAIVDDSTWTGCGVCGWFIEAHVRVFGAKAVRVHHLEPCRKRGDRHCRYRVRWSGVKSAR